MMKHRHLALLGYDVVSVPYWEWQELKSVQAKKLYMEDKLKAAVCGKSATSRKL